MLSVIMKIPTYCQVHDVAKHMNYFKSLKAFISVRVYCRGLNLDLINENSECQSGSSDLEHSAGASDHELKNNESSSNLIHSDSEIEHFYKAHNITIVGSNVPKPIFRISDANFPKIVTNYLESCKITEPGPVQSIAWPVALQKRNLVGLSPTGTGKTLGYIIPIVMDLLNSSPSKNAPAALILTPTRELCSQIYSVTNSLCGRHITCGSAYGGVPKDKQFKSLQRASICIATPGRLNDFVGSGNLNLSECKTLVLDEADEIFNAGFLPQVENILEAAKNRTQTMMWSATWHKSVESIAKNYIGDYVFLSVGSKTHTIRPNIKQLFKFCEPQHKQNDLLEYLRDVTASLPNYKILIFTNTRFGANFLNDELNREAYDSFVIQGNMSQNVRSLTLDQFRRNVPSILVCTDLVSRGLDISGITHVINYDVPSDIERYVHRIGRTGRFDAEGIAFSLVTKNDVNVIKDLVTLMNKIGLDVPEKLLELSRSSLENSSFKYGWNSGQNMRKNYQNRDSNYMRGSYHFGNRFGNQYNRRNPYNRFDRYDGPKRYDHYDEPNRFDRYDGPKRYGRNRE